MYVSFAISTLFYVHVSFAISTLFFYASFSVSKPYLSFFSSDSSGSCDEELQLDATLTQTRFNIVEILGAADVIM